MEIKILKGFILILKCGSVLPVYWFLKTLNFRCIYMAILELYLRTKIVLKKLVYDHREILSTSPLLVGKLRPQKFEQSSGDGSERDKP